MASKPTDRALVPQGLEQGARKQIVADRQQAGMPQGASLAAPGVPSDFLRATKPTRQPDIAGLLAPAEPAPLSPRDRVRAMRDSTPNAVLRETLSRMLGE